MIGSLRRERRWHRFQARYRRRGFGVTSGDTGGHVFVRICVARHDARMPHDPLDAVRAPPGVRRLLLENERRVAPRSRATDFGFEKSVSSSEPILPCA